MVMQRLAILDEEERTADKRIEEEYMRRLDNEDRYYLFGKAECPVGGHYRYSKGGVWRK